jgi:hypothetical protein
MWPKHRWKEIESKKHKGHAGAFEAMVKGTKIEIKTKVFNEKDSFLALQCIECTIFKNILPFLYH